MDATLLGSVVAGATGVLVLAPAPLYANGSGQVVDFGLTGSTRSSWSGRHGARRAAAASAAAATGGRRTATGSCGAPAPAAAGGGGDAATAGGAGHGQAGPDQGLAHEQALQGEEGHVDQAHAVEGRQGEHHGRSPQHRPQDRQALRRPDAGHAQALAVRALHDPGSLKTVSAKAGANTVKFTGSVRGRRLSPGLYRFTLRAKDSGGRTSKTVQRDVHGGALIGETVPAWRRRAGTGHRARLAAVGSKR